MPLIWMSDIDNLLRRSVEAAAGLRPSAKGWKPIHFYPVFYSVPTGKCAGNFAVFGDLNSTSFIRAPHPEFASSHQPR
jgi:hypothetical protein